MNSLVRNTQFDNLVNYEAGVLSNSSRPAADCQSSADPNALASLLKNAPLVEFSFAVADKLHVQVDATKNAATPCGAKPES
ncbi:MAG: hypothetical protein LBG47_04255 [Prevotellaceae bacterium]|jgi:hypothetical protein|nr:hypothetical protein [Prevotellaceae bacterium]